MTNQAENIVLAFYVKLFAFQQNDWDILTWESVTLQTALKYLITGQDTMGYHCALSVTLLSDSRLLS